MKTIYSLYFLILLIMPITALGQDISYTFESGENGYTSDNGSSWTNLSVYGGTCTTITGSGLGDANTTNVFKALTYNNLLSSADLTAFPSASNYSVEWTQYIVANNTIFKDGFILRAQNTATGFSAQARQGYYFSAQSTSTPTSGSVRFRIFVLTGSATNTQKLDQTLSGLTYGGTNTGPLFLKANVNGTSLSFYYKTSAGAAWTQVGTTQTDATYSSGTTQLTWGFGSGSNVAGEYIDNIGFTNLSKNISLSGSKFIHDGTAKSPDYSKTGFTSPVETITYTGISGTNYPESTSAPSAIGTYVMKANVVEEVTRTASQVFTILPASFDKLYTFEGDVNGSTAGLITTSAGANVGAGHTVQLFTNAAEDGHAVSTKTLSVNSSITNNRTISSLDYFGSSSTDYSVTWKEFNTTASANKHLIVLRADPTTSNSSFSASPNYRPQGQGYGFLVNPTGVSALTLQLYKLNTTDAWTVLTSVNLTPTAVQGVPLWFRATVTGSSSVTLKFEYSVDGTNWLDATSATDETDPVTSGATHLFGINSNNQNYHFDYFGYKTITDLTTSVSHNDKSYQTMCVSVQGKVVTISNEPNFEIFNLQGVRISNNQSNSPENSVTLTSGVYLVKSKNSIQKICVR